MTSRRDHKITGILCSVSAVALILFLLLPTTIHGQFFTKSSSKSIPRMGRRSVSTEESMSGLHVRSPYQRALVDALVDKYGPDLLGELESKASGKQQQYLANLITTTTTTNNNNNNNNELLDQYRTMDDNVFSRDERRPSAPNKPKGSGYRDASLAMRAFNTDRYIQHLASGGQPLVSLESLLGGTTSGGGGGGESGKQQLEPSSEKGLKM